MRDFPPAADAVDADVDQGGARPDPNLANIFGGPSRPRGFWQAGTAPADRACRCGRWSRSRSRAAAAATTDWRIICERPTISALDPSIDACTDLIRQMRPFGRGPEASRASRMRSSEIPRDRSGWRCLAAWLRRSPNPGALIGRAQPGASHCNFALLQRSPRSALHLICIRPGASRRPSKRLHQLSKGRAGTTAY
jgi:hypothetical protein